jgi:hypothetical protein
MPGPRIEIAELLVLHLVQFGIELDGLAVRIAVENRDVVPRSEPHRPPDDLDVLLPEQIAGGLQMGEILQLESHVVDADGLAGEEVHGVVVGIAAHEDEEVADPVGDAKAQDSRVKL